MRSPRGDFTAHPRATDDPAEVGPVDYVFLGLKANSVRGVRAADRAAAARHHGGRGRPERHSLVVLPPDGGPYDGRRLQSVDPSGAVSAVLAPERAVGCVVYAATELEQPVSGTWKAPGSRSASPAAMSSARCLALSEAMRTGGLKCPVEPDLRNDVWLKLLGNISFNPISALARATMRQMCAHGGTRQVIGTMMAETLAVAEALGCEVGVSIERRLAGAEKVGEHRTSTPRTWSAESRSNSTCSSRPSSNWRRSPAWRCPPQHRARHLGPARAEERRMRNMRKRQPKTSTRLTHPLVRDSATRPSAGRPGTRPWTGPPGA